MLIKIKSMVFQQLGDRGNEEDDHQNLVTIESHEFPQLSEHDNELVTIKSTVFLRLPEHGNELVIDKSTAFLHLLEHGNELVIENQQHSHSYLNMTTSWSQISQQHFQLPEHGNELDINKSKAFPQLPEHGDKEVDQQEVSHDQVDAQQQMKDDRAFVWTLKTYFCREN